MSNDGKNTIVSLAELTAQEKSKREKEERDKINYAISQAILNENRVLSMPTQLIYCPDFNKSVKLKCVDISKGIVYCDLIIAHDTIEKFQPITYGERATWVYNDVKERLVEVKLPVTQFDRFPTGKGLPISVPIKVDLSTMTFVYNYEEKITYYKGKEVIRGKDNEKLSDFDYDNYKTTDLSEIIPKSTDNAKLPLIRAIHGLLRRREKDDIIRTILASTSEKFTFSLEQSQTGGWVTKWDEVRYPIGVFLHYVSDLSTVETLKELDN